MPTLTLDGRSLSFEPGATILDVARAAGVDVPTLCWYPKLPNVGNCRICLVSVAGQGKLVPACATAAVDGMAVETESPAAVSNRRGVLSFLLERYPAEHLANGGRAAPRNEFERYVTRYDVMPSPAAARAPASRRRRASRRRDDPPRHESLRPVHPLRAGVRGHPGGRRPRRRGSRHACADHRGRRWRSRPRRVHLVRRVRPGLSHERDLRVHPARALRGGRTRAAGPHRALRVPLLRGRLSAGPACPGRKAHAGHVPLDRGEHAEPGVHLRQGTLRLRLRAASRPAHAPPHPARLGAGRRGCLALDRGMATAPGRAVASDRGDRTDAEISRNPRARSSIMRVAERMAA